MQLNLFKALDTEFPEPPAGIEQWRVWDRRLLREDEWYPIETIKVKGGEIYLRCIDGLWLWGVDIAFPYHGCGFYPFRKWGASYASVDRISALAMAKEFIAAEALKDRKPGKTYA